MNSYFLKRCKKKLGIFVAIFSFMISGCTTVHIHGAEPDKIKMTQGFGVLNLDIKEMDTITFVTDVEGIGLVTGVTHNTFGYMHEETVIMPDASKCRAIFIVKNLEEAKKIQKTLKLVKVDLNKLCVPRNP